LNPSRRVPLHFTLLLVFLASACLPLIERTEPEDPDVSQTSVIETLYAEFYAAMTQTAGWATLTSLQEATASLVPSPSVTLTETPTGTPTATSTSTPTAVPTPKICDWAGFVSETVKDNTVVDRNQRFRKTWRVQNIGSCVWTPEYDLVFIDGDRLGAPTEIPLPGYVLPGESVDLTVTFTAPSYTGTFTGYWQLRNANGALFGLGGDANGPFWVRVKIKPAVGSFTGQFATEYCLADWESATGALPCPGKEGSGDGFVLFLDQPQLENRPEDEPTLWMRPNKKILGWIRGIYPSYTVKKYDHFLAWVGCLKNSNGCDVTFELLYQEQGERIKRLGSWEESHDGKVSVINLDLSSLAGKKVRFILSVTNHGTPDKANAFWFVPQIRNSPPATATPTPTLTPTPTSTSTETPTSTETSTPTVTNTP